MTELTDKLPRRVRLARQLNFVGDVSRDEIILQEAVDKGIVTKKDVRLAGADILSDLERPISNLVPYQQAIVKMTTKGYEGRPLDTLEQRQNLAMEIQANYLYP